MPRIEVDRGPVSGSLVRTQTQVPYSSGPSRTVSSRAMSLAPPSHSYSGGEGNGVASDDADRISPGRAISLTRTKEAARDLPAVAISARESARSYAALTKEDAERQPEEKLAFETRLSEDIFNFLVQI